MFNLLNHFSNAEFTEVELAAFKKKHLTCFLQFDREKTALKHYLLGKGYILGLKALGFSERYHFKQQNGEIKLRKDKATPAFHHQIRIALSVTQLKDIIDEEKCIIAALLHDVQEDEGVQSSEIAKEFGQEIADINWRLTKKFAGNHKNKEEYISSIAMCYVASIVKGLDRYDNLTSMIGVFNRDKMIDYSNEAETVFLKMIKTASKLYPEQHYAYTQISLLIKRQISMVRYYVESLKEVETVKTTVDSLKVQVEDLKTLLKITELKKESATASVENLKRLLEELKMTINLNNQERIDPFVVFNSVEATMKSEKISLRASNNILGQLAKSLGLATLQFTNFDQDQLSEGCDQVSTL